MARPRPPVKRKPIAAAAGGGIPVQAQAELDPVLAAIAGQANQQAYASEAAIRGLTDAYARELGNVDLGAPYAGAEAQQAAVDAALRQSLAGQGSSLASGLASRLSALQHSSGAPALGQAGQALAGQGAAAGNTRVASGSANLGNLIADAANASSYSRTLPGLARLSGLQGVRQAEGNRQQAVNQGTVQVESQLPQIEQQLRSSRQQAKALASENAYRKAEIGLSSQRNTISAQRLNLEAQSLAQRTLNENRSYQLALGRLGVSQKSLQLKMMTAQAKANGGGYTPNELRGMQVQANQIASDASKHQASLQQVMHTMALNDIPPTVALKASKLAGYQPGKPGMFAGFGKGLGRPFAAAGGAVETAAAQRITALAHEYLGTPYVWGGASPRGFDCSGFAQFLYRKAGIAIPRTTYTQWQTGRAVAKGALAPGDLVFFRGSDSVGGLPGHVGIYIGNGQMIDAPHTGTSVRIESVNGFGGYMGARRYG